MAVKVQSTIEPYNDSYKAVNAKHVGFDDGDAEKSLDSMFNETPANIGDGSAARQLNNRHLEPFEFVYTGDPVDIFAERTVTGFAYDSATGYWYAAQGFSASGLQDGQTYIVVWNGTKYTCVATSMASEILLGNMKPFGFEDNGYPFLISGAGWMYALDSEAASHVVRVYQNPPGKWVLKSARLPSGVGTGGSEITVDSELSLESENPVQNKVVTQEFKAFNEAIGDTNRRVSALEGGGMQATVVDLTALGLPPIEVGTGQTLTTDTTEIIAALDKGVVTFGLDIVRESGTIHYNVTTNTLNADGMYFCYFTGGDGNEQETISIAVGTGIIIAAVSVTPVGGGVSSWNDLTDKPFGENADGTIKQLDNKYLEPFEFQTGSEIDILPRQDVQFAGGDGEPNGVAVFVVGETYRVKWDATEYVFEAKSVVFDGIDGIAIGNTSLIGAGEDTGEEFVLGYAPAYNINLFVTKPTDNGTHSVRIYQSTPNKWTLKESHLPFDAIAAYIDNYINEALGGDY